MRFLPDIRPSQKLICPCRNCIFFFLTFLLALLIERKYEKRDRTVVKRETYHSSRHGHRSPRRSHHSSRRSSHYV